MPRAQMQMQHEVRGALVFYISVNWNHPSSGRETHWLPLQLVFWKHTALAQYGTISCVTLFCRKAADDKQKRKHIHCQPCCSFKMSELNFIWRTFNIIRVTSWNVATETDQLGVVFNKNWCHFVVVFKCLRLELLERRYRRLHWRAALLFALAKSRVRRFDSAAACCVAAALAELVARWCSRRFALRLQLVARLPSACTCSHLPGEKMWAGVRKPASCDEATNRGVWQLITLQCVRKGLWV